MFEFIKETVLNLLAQEAKEKKPMTGYERILAAREVTQKRPGFNPIMEYGRALDLGEDPTVNVIQLALKAMQKDASSILPKGTPYEIYTMKAEYAKYALAWYYTDTKKLREDRLELGTLIAVREVE